jgi:hypothetical protein
MSKRIKKQANETKLERVARVWLNSRAADYSDGWKGVYKDLEYGGCESGLVGKLIYYNDTTRFYRRHRADINALLTEAMQSSGLKSMTELFGDKWDIDDPLAQNDLNQNLLAWFGFEESARNVAMQNGYDS